MKIARCGTWVIGSLTLAFSALGDDATSGQPLLRANFDHLIPTSYPVFHPNFHRLIPTTQPLIQPGVPKIHITDNLTQSFARPLLITNDNSCRALPAAADRPPPILLVHSVPPVLVTARTARPRLVGPDRASTSPKGPR